MSNQFKTWFFLLGYSLFLTCFISCKEDLSSEKQITSFKIVSPALNYEAEGSIDQTNLSISTVIPSEMDLKKLSPIISISQGAKINPPAEVNTDFTGGVVYTVTAEDGSVANYFATVNQKSINANLTFIKIPDLDLNGTIDGETISFEFPFGTDVSSQTLELGLPANATSSVSSGTSVNFETFKELIITSELGIQKTYQITYTFTPASTGNQISSFELPDYYISGSIINDKIILNLLYGTDLNKVRVNLTLSENAVSSLTDLEETNLEDTNAITVTSQAGTERIYTLEKNYAPQETGVRGVWLTNVASSVLFSRQSIAQAMQLLADLNFNTVFLVTWNKTQTPHPSQVLENVLAPLNNPNIQTRFDPNRDILQEVIEEAHARNLKVIAWFEYGFASQYGNANNGLNPVLQANPTWASRDESGSVANKNGFYWMNPFNPEVQNFMTDLILEVVSNYDVDGIQGDDRLPAVTTTAGYDDYTVQRYRDENGGANPPSASNNAWIRWRANILSDYAETLFNRVKAINPNCLVTFSPSAYSFSLYNYCQDWPEWVDRNVVEILSPQLYRYESAGIGEYRYLFNVNLNYAKNRLDVFYPGVLLQSGNYVPSDDYLVDVVRHHRSKGVFGEVFFFYEGVDDKIKAFKALYPGPALFPNFNQ
ncbi:MAG: hypothetical protein RLZZ241_608 [Bacteroidota bacterium]|jgi:uncharacterized lipoprotein YddW (UPF0748 family)